VRGFYSPLNASKLLAAGIKPFATAQIKPVQRLLFIGGDKPGLALMKHLTCPVFRVTRAREGGALLKPLRGLHIILRHLHAVGVNQPQQQLGIDSGVILGIRRGFMQ